MRPAGQICRMPRRNDDIINQNSIINGENDNLRFTFSATLDGDRGFRQSLDGRCGNRDAREASYGPIRFDGCLGSWRNPNHVRRRRHLGDNGDFKHLRLAR